MTDREKAIVMAFTGKCMLIGDKFQIFHKYVEDIMGRPIWTHELRSKSIADEISEKSKDDFIALCTDESSSEKPNKWIPVNERSPEKNEWVLVTVEQSGNRYQEIMRRNKYIDVWTDNIDNYTDGITAWMPLPAPFEPQESEETNADSN